MGGRGERRSCEGGEKIMWRGEGEDREEGEEKTMWGEGGEEKTMWRGDTMREE